MPVGSNQLVGLTKPAMSQSFLDLVVKFEEEATQKTNND